MFSVPISLTMMMRFGTPRRCCLNQKASPVQLWVSADAFLLAWDGSQKGCLVLDIRMPGLSGLELQQELIQRECLLPIIFMTGHGDLPLAVEAMRRGAIDFLRKPVDEEALVHRVRQAFEQELGLRKQSMRLADIHNHVATLTEREFEIYKLVTIGETNKIIANGLGISERTVEVHRARVMEKMAATTMAQLVRMRIESDREQ